MTALYSCRLRLYHSPIFSARAHTRIAVCALRGHMHGHMHLAHVWEDEKRSTNDKHKTSTTR